MKQLLIITLLFFNLIAFKCLGQFNDSLNNEKFRKLHFQNTNSINLEAFGHGLFYSLSYEKIIINKFNYKIGGQIGVAPYFYPGSIDLWIPISINYIKSFGITKKHHLEGGIGHVFRYNQYYDGRIHSPWNTVITAKLGYRYQKPNGKWIFKIMFTPFYWYDYKNPKIKISTHNTFVSDNPLPSGTISFGRSF